MSDTAGSSDCLQNPPFSATFGAASTFISLPPNSFFIVIAAPKTKSPAPSNSSDRCHNCWQLGHKKPNCSNEYLKRSMDIKDPGRIKNSKRKRNADGAWTKGKPPKKLICSGSGPSTHFPYTESKELKERKAQEDTAAAVTFTSLRESVRALVDSDASHKEQLRVIAEDAAALREERRIEVEEWRVVVEECRIKLEFLKGHMALLLQHICALKGGKSVSMPNKKIMVKKENDLNV